MVTYPVIRFRGWSARLWSEGFDERRVAQRTAAGLRAWNLPAGDYRMRATSRHPWLGGYLAIAAGGLLAWLAGALALRSAAREPSRQPSGPG